MSKKLFGAHHSSRRRSRTTGMAAGLAAFALIATACGGSAGGGTGGGGGGGQSAGAGGGGGGASGEDKYVSVTAKEKTCPSGMPGKGKPPVRLGTKDFTEQFLLGQMYKQALESRGYTVKYQSNVGGSEVIDQAFNSGELDMYPEYLGEIETSIAGYDKPAKKVEDTYNRAKQFEESKRGATILKQTPYQNTDAVIVKADFARQNNLKSVGDLKNVKGGVKLAGQSSFQTRFNGLKGMKQVYGLNNIQFLGTTQGQQYDILKDGESGVNAIDAFSTDAQLTTFDNKLLDDPQNIFGYQYVAPVVKQSVAKQQGPQFAATLNCVTSKLNTKVMQALNAQIQLNGRDEGQVAQKFLKANKVLK